jgi:PAS domain S-box-containing protein
LGQQDLLLGFVRQVARHSGLQGDSLDGLLRAAHACLLDGTGVSEVGWLDVDVAGEDMLLVHEIGLAQAALSAGLADASAAIAAASTAAAAASYVETSAPRHLVGDDGAAWIPVRGVDGVVAIVRIALPAGDEPSDEMLAFAGEVIDELASALLRHWRDVQHRDRADVLREAQRSTHSGCFEWDTVTNKVRWSDELFRIFGYDPQSFEPTFEEFLEQIHPDDRDAVRASVYEAYEERRDYRIEERIIRPDGSVRLLSSRGQVITNERSEPVKIIGSCLDVTDTRRVIEDLAATERRLAEIDDRRNQALEINDNVVQGLATASYALQLGMTEEASVAVQGTLFAARSMIDERLSHGGADVEAAGWVRERPAPAFLSPTAAPDPTAPRAPRAQRAQPPTSEGLLRVVIADDSADIRLLVSFSLRGDQGFQVVGEAADGLEAIAQAARLQPDVMLLDLAMPELDGLAAIPAIREASPHTRIVMLSGFDAGTAANLAIERGAAAFIEKGRMDLSLGKTIRDICDAPSDNDRV